MTIKTVSAFQTPDGKVHTSEELANSYWVRESTKLRVAAIVERELPGNEIDRDWVIDTLLDNSDEFRAAYAGAPLTDEEYTEQFAVFETSDDGAEPEPDSDFG